MQTNISQWSLGLPRRPTTQRRLGGAPIPIKTIDLVVCRWPSIERSHIGILCRWPSIERFHIRIRFVCWWPSIERFRLGLRLRVVAKLHGLGPRRLARDAGVRLEPAGPGPHAVQAEAAPPQALDEAGVDPLQGADLRLK